MATQVVEQVPTEQVIQGYRTAVTLNPSYAVAQSNLGWGLHFTDMLAEAVVAFQRALDLDLNFLDAKYGLALTYKKLNRKEEARAAFENAIKLTDQLEDRFRARMLRRLAVGHIHEMDTGDWGLSGVARPDLENV